MANRLSGETSPYLLQHADNPVDWFPWGEEALERARSEDKPILLSIGYSACHWCHVMAHESFEDPQVAAFMNEHFVNIKVDREERPDLDSIYMDAVVAMTGQGGWPMTVVLTPEGRPFYGGTYYPPVPRFGMPSFRQVLASVARAWEERRGEIVDSAGQITAHISRHPALNARSEKLRPELLGQAVQSTARSFDGVKGGFGQAPKFPQPMVIEYLLRYHLQSGDAFALHMAVHTLDMMAKGGMYDQLGGGFARYSTDNDWLVPHFEKMLYDNALLSLAYLHAWRVTGRPMYRRVVIETLDWVLREMRDAGGGFYSSMDADSEGEEGKFYVWDATELRQILGDEADPSMAAYGASDQGNWEGKNVLHVARTANEVANQFELDPNDVAIQLTGAKQLLADYRERRVRPGLDDKVLTSWNGLMLAAFAEAGRDLNRPEYTEAAVANADFLSEKMRRPDGRLFRTWKAGGSGRVDAFLEDYAYLAHGLLALYQSTFDARWFQWATELAASMVNHFADTAHGGFFDTPDDHEALIHRPKDVQDNATPSGNAIAATVLLQLALYQGNSSYWERAEEAVAGMSEAMIQHPTAFGQWLCAAAFILAQPREVAIIGRPSQADAQELVQTVFSQYRPDLVVALGEDDGQVPLLADRTRLNNQATAYVCRRFVCDLPVTSAEALAEQLGD
ncbi:MAG: thioredoxin domain-containing protein [Candidatus Promineifilaceae bacterium]